VENANKNLHFYTFITQNFKKNDKKMTFVRFF